MEIFDLYTVDREKTGETRACVAVHPKGFYHMVVHICIFGSDGKMLIQQRQKTKSGWPNLWDVSSAGAVVSGETSRDGAHRELLEELGVDISFDEMRPSMTVNFDNGFDDIYLINKDVELKDLKLQTEEVKDARFASMDEILDMLDKGQFVPYYPELIRLMFSMRHKMGMHK